MVEGREMTEHIFYRPEGLKRESYISPSVANDLGAKAFDDLEALDDLGAGAG